MKRTVALLFQLALAAGVISMAYADSSGRFVVLSDIHAYACGTGDGGPCAQTSPATCPVSGVPLCSANLNDTDQCLFQSLLEDIACTQAGKTDFVIYSGDWIAHAYENPGNADKKKQIIATLSTTLHQQFGTGTLIVPALGNNDAYNGDYNVQPCLEADLKDCQDAAGSYKLDAGQFLSDTLLAWKPLLASADELGTACGAGGLEQSFLRGGYYALSNPHLPDNCTLVLNTVLLGKNFIQGTSGSWGRWLKGSGFEAAAMQLTWLEQRLKNAKANGKNVWLIYHVPPGADAYGSNSNKSPTMMYVNQPWPGGIAPAPPGSNPAGGFLQLMSDHHDVIEAAFAGHTHMDSFRVLYANGKPVSWVHVTPSISPQHHGTDAAYQQFDYRVANNRTVLDNYTTRRRDFSTDSRWTMEYNWKNQFCAPSCSYDDMSLSGVYQAMIDPQHPGHESLKDRYKKFYGEEASSIDDASWKYYVCAIGQLNESDYETCFSAK